MIFVGVDGSAGSRSALRWALAEAELRSEPLRVLHAGPPTSELVRRTPLVERRHETESRGLWELVAAERAFAVAQVDLDVVDGDAVEVLVAEAVPASLLVVGRRGVGSVGAAVAGSVSHNVARRARCPVAVVPPCDDGKATRPGRVVVGVDDSPNATAALRWAAEEAGVRDVPLVIVHAIPSPGPDDVIAAVPVDASVSVAADASVLVRREARGPITVSPYVSREPAGRALVRFVEPDDLLVVGTHARGAIARFFLGSTSAYCIEHSHCPVVVVPFHA